LYHSLALRSDGTVAGWGFNGYAAATPPPDLHDAVAIAAGEEHSLALRSDSTVTGWGWDVEGQVTPPPGLSNVLGIAAGRLHSLAVRSDGTVVAWGNNAYGQTTVPAGLTNAVAVAAGYYHSMALGSDGSVWAWGDGSFGQTLIPNGFSHAVAIAAGGNHCLAIVSNGLVVAWGDSSAGQTIVPNWLSNVVALAQGGEHCVAIPGGRPFLAGQPKDQTAIAGTAAQFHVSTTWKSLALNYQWQFNGTDLARGTNAILTLLNVSPASTGNYQVVVANVYGAVTSAPAKLTVVFPPTIVQGPVNQTSSVPRSITFSVTATGAQPLSYQWQKDGASLAGASGTALVLPSVTRTNSGSYSVVITNLYGIAVSSNAYLAVRLPQRLSPPALMPDGSLSLTSADSDGSAPTSADLSHLHAYASTNLVDWVSLPGALSITNGVLQLQDAPCPACLERFYRIVESW
jgi:hypothetical protein